jgi:epsilon-lactone hydrolase
MSFSNNRRAAIRKLKLLTFTSHSEVELFRTRIEDTFSNPLLPNHVECAEYDYGGIHCDVLVPEIYSSKRIMLYIHGGSFVGGSPDSWRSFCAVLANRSYSRIVVPKFRLAPQYPYPASVEDVQAVFRALFTEIQVACSLDARAGEISPQPEIIIGADSSGASIAFSFLFNLREKYRACISHVILLSPWLNLSSDSLVITGKKNSDEVMSGEVLKRSGELYTIEKNLSDPFISPVNATADILSGFPPVYIQMGEREILLPDALQLKKNLEAAGNICVVEAVPDMMFMFQMADEYLWESHGAVEKLGKIIASINDTSEKTVIENKPVLEQSLRSEA